MSKDKGSKTPLLGRKWDNVSDGESKFEQQSQAHYKRFCERNNMRFCNIHSMCHFYTSVLISSGVDVTTVSNQLGHSNSNATLGIYSHMFEEARVKSCDAITNALNFKKQPSEDKKSAV